MLRLKLPATLLSKDGMHWDDPADAPENNDTMMGMTEAGSPMRDDKGRMLHIAPDREAFLAQLPPNATNDELFALLLQVDAASASPCLRALCFG